MDLLAAKMKATTTTVSLLLLIFLFAVEWSTVEVNAGGRFKRWLNRAANKPANKPVERELTIKFSTSWCDIIKDETTLPDYAHNDIDEIEVGDGVNFSLRVDGFSGFNINMGAKLYEQVGCFGSIEGLEGHNEPINNEPITVGGKVTKARGNLHLHMQPSNARMAYERMDAYDDDDHVIAFRMRLGNDDDDDGRIRLRRSDNISILGIGRIKGLSTMTVSVKQIGVERKRKQR